MKKYTLLLIIFLCASSLFARDFTFLAVETDKNSVTECYGESISTVKTKDDIEISVSVDRCDDGDNFRVCVDFKNLGDEPFKFDENNIKAYYGNYDEAEWDYMDYVPASEFYEDAKGDAVFRTVFAAVTLGLAAIDSGLAPDPFDFPPLRPAPSPRVISNGGHGPRVYEAHRSSRHDGDPIWVGLGLINLFGTIDENENTLDYLSNHLLFSEKIGPDEGYSGLFYLPEEKGPDYKISIRVSREETVDFYFSRSDRERVLHPFMDIDENQFAMTFNLGSSTDFNLHFGMDFLFCNKGLGGYFGLGYGNKESYHYLREDILFDGGITDKLCPHLWIIGGIGCTYFEETTRDNDNHRHHHNGFTIGPEVGLNAIYGPLDFGGKVRYKVFGPVEIEVMMGVCF